MLCAGVVHGDLSEFNILLAADGPVVIDLPQAVDAAGNNHAKRMLLRDVTNLNEFFGRFAPELLDREHGHEIWQLYERGLLHIDAAAQRAASSTIARRSTWPACCARWMTARSEEAMRQLRMQSR
jgi:RIO kinase 1